MKISKSLYETVSAILLREFDETITWNKLGAKLFQVWNSFEGNEPVESTAKSITMETITRADPTQNKKYSLWIATRISNKDPELVKLLDEKKSASMIIIVNEVLKLFDALKNNRKISGADADINKYKTYKELTEKLESFPEEEFISNKSKKRDIAKEMQKQAELFLSTPEYTVIIPKTEEASCYYGQNTKWCTAATDGNNMFSHYARDGNLYIIIPKNPAYDGEKYQVHFNPISMMDELDEEVEFETMLEKFPEFFEKAAEAGELEDSDYVVFMKKEVKQRMIDNFNEFINQTAYDIELDAEQNDEGYTEYIASEYKDEDGEIDWERGYEEMPYSEYNSDLSWWTSKNLEDYKFSDLSELAEWLKQYSQYEEPATALYVGRFFKWVINEKAVENRDDTWYTDSLKDKVKELSVNKKDGSLY